MDDNSTFRNESQGNHIDATSKMYLNVLVIIVSTIICIGGFWGNFIIATIVLKRKKMHTPTNWFVFNLAISDLMIIVITIPLWIAVPKINWPFGSIGCKYLIMPVMEHFTGVCVLTHTAVGVARYVIVKNSKTRQAISNLQVKVTVASIWIIAFLCLSAPLMGPLGEFYYRSNSTTGIIRCELRWKNNQARYAYRVVTFTLTYVIPMVATGFSYVRIHQLVSQTLECLNGHVSAAMFSTRQRQTSQMNTILMTMYVLFAITTLPLQLFFFLHAFYMIPNTVWAPLAMDGLFVLFYSQVVINPLVLFYMGENYRKEVYKLSICCCYNEPKLRDFSLMVKDNVQAVGERLQKHRALTGSTRIGDSSGRMRLASLGARVEGESKKKKQSIDKANEVNGHLYEIIPEVEINGNKYENISDSATIQNKHSYKKSVDDNLAEEYSGLLYDEVKDMKAYYDDGTLMYIYDKSIGCVSLAHDNGRETSI